jgi:hypothetical protein
LLQPVQAALKPEPLLETGFRQMYNLDFGEAHVTFRKHIALHPEDPMGPASDAAAFLFSEFDRLHILQGEFFLHDQNFSVQRKLSPDPMASAAFRARLDEALALAHKQLQSDPRQANALFANVLALGLRSDYDGLIEHRYLTTLQETKESRRLAEQLLSIDPEAHDAWIAVGVENYLLSLKPLPVRWVLQLAGNATDRTYGIEKLHITEQKGVYLGPFARLLLAVAALRDGRDEEAAMRLRSLAEEFPRNRLYTEELARLGKR